MSLLCNNNNNNNNFQWSYITFLFAYHIVFSGQKLIERARPDLISKFSSAVDGDVQAVSQYIFQCNAQKPRLRHAELKLCIH